MSIHLSILPSSTASLESQFSALQEAGFHSIELSAADASRLKPALAAAGVKVSCLLTTVNLHERDAGKWEASLADLASALRVAAELHVPCVRVLPGELSKGEGLTAGISRLAKRIAEILVSATDSDVGIAIQNAGSFVQATPMWQLLETVSHPLVGVCLDLAATSLSGESPILAIPTLNSRIFHVRVWDYKDGKAAPLGTGDAKIKIAIDRLRGIGYEGAISLAPPGGIDTADTESFKAIGHHLGHWTGLIHPPAPPERHKPHNPPKSPPPPMKPAEPVPAT